MDSHDAPDRKPKPQSAHSGGPPSPPKKTAAGLGDDDHDSDETRRARFEFQMALEHADRLVELLGYLRDSRWAVAINKLEADLDSAVVALAKGSQLIPRYGPLLAKRHLDLAREYRRKHPRVDTGDWKTREQAKSILEEKNK